MHTLSYLKEKRKLQFTFAQNKKINNINIYAKFPCTRVRQLFRVINAKRIHKLIAREHIVLQSIQFNIKKI